ncbi:hypothetical protein [Thermosporothrix hazakensis]|uniref:Uncharacterized protein n=1 Tax=Thermosporothrix sp. COM3 TaxID=2490863 RepID=A0A455SJU5_9CHLR|nr:hypothetical protein [Thermosporothrix hazakensis]BBH88733.1 hypothetical protein KTC_34840 [Thermosporothrix sp. COM3]
MRDYSPGQRGKQGYRYYTPLHLAILWLAHLLVGPFTGLALVSSYRQLVKEI